MRTNREVFLRMANELWPIFHMQVIRIFSLSTELSNVALSEKTETVIFNNFTLFLDRLGIKSRDGFGFSQTTKILITYPHFLDVIRISIGTESLREINTTIYLKCLVQIL